MTDTLYETLDCQGKTVVVWETLPGQYDQRADSAMPVRQAAQSRFRLPDYDRKADDAGRGSRRRNAEENRSLRHQPDRIPCEGFDPAWRSIRMSTSSRWNNFQLHRDDAAAIQAFVKEHGLAMSEADLALVQRYFREEEKRNPTETEIRVTRYLLVRSLPAYDV